MDTLGERLKRLRGDTPGAEVADKIGVPYATYRSYEADLRVPRDDMKIKIAKYFGVHIGDLFYPQE